MIITNCISHRPQHTRLKFQLKVWPEKFILFRKANLMIALLNNLEIQSGIKLFHHSEREVLFSTFTFISHWNQIIPCIALPFIEIFSLLESREEVLSLTLHLESTLSSPVPSRSPAIPGSSFHLESQQDFGSVSFNKLEQK